MGQEIERKYLIKSNAWRTLVTSSVSIHQGYLCKHKNRTVRIRTWGNEGKVTIKSAAVHGVRTEYEYDIPFHDAQAMLSDLCEPFPIHKTRHIVQVDTHTWEIDEFHGPLEGLYLAEIELSSTEESFQMPPWVGLDVTEDHRYSNSNLSGYSASDWRVFQQDL